MKKALLLSILFITWLSSVTGQNPFVSCAVDFETNPCWEGTYSSLTIQGPSNIWHICTPDKPVFNSAYSPPHAILTDSTGPYPVNNTSSFIIKFIPYSFCMCSPVIGGYYKFDSDTLTDFGRIEFSVDHGATWLNALSDTVIPDMLWWGTKPVLTGRIHQWRAFHALLWNYFTSDTLYYRYTFVSDSIQTNRQGWMLDDIALIDHTEGIRDRVSRDELSIYPDPTDGPVTIKSENDPGQMDVSVYNLQGQLLLEQKMLKNNGEFNISGLARGLYMVRVLSRNNFHVRMLMKE